VDARFLARWGSRTGEGIGSSLQYTRNTNRKEDEMRTGLGVVTAVALVLGQAATAQSATGFSYAVQFLCGRFSGDNPLEPVVPGLYLTAISVANPNEGTVGFTYDALTFGRISFPRTEDELDERNARRLDCDFLFGDRADDGLLKGILYIVAEERLDVWAVYTARELGAGDQISINAVQVLGRRLEDATVGKLGE
jgi:hypothetical protein